MSEKSVFCVVQNPGHAEQIVTQLKNAEFTEEDISVLLPDPESTREFAEETKVKAPEGMISDVSKGGLIGGTLGMILGIGALAIPGVGPFIAAGPIVAALSGAAIGAATGSIAGVLVGMGVPEIEAKSYELDIEAGKILISVHAADSKEIERAKAIFTQANAEGIYATGEEEPA